MGSKLPMGFDVSDIFERMLLKDLGCHICNCNSKCNLFTHQALRSSKELVKMCPLVPDQIAF